MKWPWVSREAFDIVAAELVAERQRYADLFARYDGLKVQGAAAAPEPLPVKPPDPVAHAMLARARGKPLLMRHLREVVDTMRGEGKADAEIAHTILAGVDVTDEGIPG